MRKLEDEKTLQMNQKKEIQKLTQILAEQKRKKEEILNKNSEEKERKIEMTSENEALIQEINMAKRDLQRVEFELRKEKEIEARAKKNLNDVLARKEIAEAQSQMRYGDFQGKIDDLEKKQKDLEKEIEIRRNMAKDYKEETQDEFERVDAMFAQDKKKKLIRLEKLQTENAILREKLTVSEDLVKKFGSRYRDQEEQLINLRMSKEKLASELQLAKNESVKNRQERSMSTKEMEALIQELQAKNKELQKEIQEEEKGLSSKKTKKKDDREEELVTRVKAQPQLFGNLDEIF